MKTISCLITLIFCIITFIGSGQELLHEYYPFDSNKKKIYATDYGDTLTVSHLLSQININGKNYIVEKTTRRNNTTELPFHEFYYRLDSGNVYVTQEGQRNESLFLPLNPKIGQTWFSNDNGWRNTVVDLNASLTIPMGKFRSLLKIQEFDLELPEDTATYFSYYKNGLGLVARTRNGKIITEYLGRD